VESLWKMGLIALMLCSNAALAGFKIDGKPKVVFNATGSPGFLTFEGVTRDITLADDGEKLVFTVPVDTLDTGIEVRDDHMRRTYVQTDQFPNAIITLSRAGVTWPESGSSEGTVKGVFQLHGVDQEVEITYSIKRVKTAYRVKASFPFNTSKHGIEIPSYLGVTIAPEMDGEVTVELLEEAAAQ